MNENTSNSEIQLGQVLRQKKDQIISRWEKDVRYEINSARGLPAPALIDSLPEVLDKMVETLSASSPHQELKLKEKNIALKHGLERTKLTDYTLEEVIREYNVLRNVIFDAVDPEGNLPLKSVKLMWDSIFIAIRNAATEFTKIRELEGKKLQDLLSESHKKLGVELKDTHVNFNSIIDAVGDYAIFTLDPSGIILTWNEGAARMKEYTRDEAIGRNYSMLYTEEGRTRNEPIEHLKAARIEGRFRGEGTRVKKSGETFIADVYIIPIKRQADVVGYTKIVQDLTEHNQLVQERDLSVTEATNLKEENEMREIFIASLTHDLRNPLSAALASAQFIIRNPLDQEKTIKLAYKIVDHIRRTDKLISNLLDSNKLQAGEKLVLYKEESDLQLIVNDVIDEFSTIHGDKVVLKGQESVIGFWDSEGIKRVIENLLTNAIKYGDIGRPSTVTYERIDGRAVIKVHNFGKAIETPDQLLLFEKFHRTEDAKKGGKQGWGIGLSVAKGIVEAHEGTIKVESYPKEGTTFTVDIPLRLEP
ncbi:MAG TPA: ATP-binding protein [Bacteriovoracaceae bacterium]|nr:ATP-binding protein [Bacteriovoracaceae bacterium]